MIIFFIFKNGCYKVSPLLKINYLTKGISCEKK